MEAYAADLLPGGDLLPEAEQSGENEGDGEVDDEVDDPEFEQALALNQQLKALYLEMESAPQAHQRRPNRSAGTARSLLMGQAPRKPEPRSLGHAKNGGWGGLTHTAGREQEIGRENQILVQKLSAINTNRGKLTGGITAPFRPKPGKSSTAINQRRKDDQIARENAAMARRLNTVKATSTLSRKHTDEHAKRHARHVSSLGTRDYGALGAREPASRAPPMGPASRQRLPSAGQRLPKLSLRERPAFE